MSRELGSIDVMRLDQTLGQSRHVACASGCLSMRTSLEEGIKLHRFTAIFPEQFLTEARRHRKAVVAADQRMVIRCFRDDFSGFVHDVSHMTSPIQRGLSRPSSCRQNGNQGSRSDRHKRQSQSRYVDDGSPSWISTRVHKHDGFRLMVRRDGSRVRCFARNGNDWADRFPAMTGQTRTTGRPGVRVV
jgi:hypothetical protein